MAKRVSQGKGWWREAVVSRATAPATRSGRRAVRITPAQVREARGSPWRRRNAFPLTPSPVGQAKGGPDTSRTATRIPLNSASLPVSFLPDKRLAPTLWRLPGIYPTPGGCPSKV